MLQWIYIACHGTVTIIGLFGVWIKLEHRLTKIETDVSWIKQRVQWEIERESAHEKHCKVDSA